MASVTDLVSTPENETGQRGSSKLDSQLLRQLYAYMLKCRMVEERIRLLYRQGRVGNYFAAIG